MVKRLAFARANTLRGSSVIPLCLLATVALSLGAFGYHPRHTTVAASAAALVQSLPQAVQAPVDQIMQSAPVQAAADTGAALGAAIATVPVASTREVELDDGQNFAEMLTSQGVSDAEAAGAMNALAKVYDLRRLRAGQDITLTFQHTGRDEAFTSAIFQPEDTKEITVARNTAGDFTANIHAIPVMRQRFAAKAEIRSSLYEAGDSNGVPHAIMATLIRTYSHDIDFQRDIHPGDSFEVLYDQSVTAKGKTVGEGTIVYAAMHVGNKVKPIYRVTFSDNTVDYFDETGHSIRRALLRTPVAAARITSGFGMRMHPLLGYSKMHKGVDFGAPMGAPIFAAGNGVIEDIGFKNGYGRYIKIKHNSTIATAYAHMSRFNAKLYHGAHVNQGEVIGYVGMSGRATGPHLHFETIVNGQQVNPMSVNMPTGRVLEGKLLTAFKAGQSQIKHEYEDLLTKKSAQTGAKLVPASAPIAITPKQTGKI